MSNLWRVTLRLYEYQPLRFKSQVIKLYHHLSVCYSQVQTYTRTCLMPHAPFLEKFSYTVTLCNTTPVLLLGDFNILTDDPSNVLVSQFCSLFFYGILAFSHTSGVHPDSLPRLISYLWLHHLHNLFQVSCSPTSNYRSSSLLPAPQFQQPFNATGIERFHYPLLSPGSHVLPLISLDSMVHQNNHPLAYIVTSLAACHYSILIRQNTSPA